MPDLSLLSILAITIAAYVAGVWTTKTANDRFDEILAGVVKGNQVSVRQRWLMLTNNWLPYVAFMIVFLVIVGLGVFVPCKGG